MSSTCQQGIRKEKNKAPLLYLNNCLNILNLYLVLKLFATTVRYTVKRLCSPVNFNIISFILHFRLLEAGEAAGYGKLPLRPKPRGAGYLHLLCPRADPRLWTAGSGQCDHRTAAGFPEPTAGSAADQNLVSGATQLEQWDIRQGTHSGILHRVQAKR